MRLVDKSLQRAIAALAKAKQRGRRDEINRAALAVGRAKQAVQRDNAKQLAEQAEKTREQEERRERLENPQTDAERRSAAAVKGWETRRRNQLERERAVVQDNTPKRLRAGPLRVFALDDRGEMWPTRRTELNSDEQEAYDAIISAFGTGREMFKTYTVAAPDETPKYWIGAVVWIENGEVQYRFTPRALTEREATVNVEALANTDSGGKGRQQVCAVIPLL